MIASFFRHLEQHQVRWLLSSGQATILYGAATFSERRRPMGRADGTELRTLRGSTTGERGSVLQADSRTDRRKRG
jgi:hypothetical protein